MGRYILYGRIAGVEKMPLMGEVNINEEHGIIKGPIQIGKDSLRLKGIIKTRRNLVSLDFMPFGLVSDTACALFQLNHRGKRRDLFEREYNGEYVTYSCPFQFDKEKGLFVHEQECPTLHPGDEVRLYLERK